MVIVQQPTLRAQDHVTVPPAPWLCRVRRDGRPWVRTPPPTYERKRLPERSDRRDRWWRRDAIIAVDEALRAGELSLHQAAVIRAVLSFSDDRGTVVWAGQEAIGTAMGGRSERTARRWLRQAEAAGWVEVEHRCERRQGRWHQLTNLTRVVLPEVVELRRTTRKSAGERTPRPAPEPVRPVVVDPVAQQQAAVALVAPEAPTAPVQGPLADRLAKLRAKAQGPP